MEEEVWKQIENFPGYEVSDLGRVRSYKWTEPRVLKGKQTSYGYIQVTILHKQLYVHRLVAQAFLPNPENKPQVNHLNGIRTDNSIQNLEWCTSSENNLHSYRCLLRTPTQGQEHHLAKLSDRDVQEIREKLWMGKRGIGKQLAQEYGVCESRISNIKKGKAWNRSER